MFTGDTLRIDPHTAPIHTRTPAHSPVAPACPVALATPGSPSNPAVERKCVMDEWEPNVETHSVNDTLNNDAMNRDALNSD